MCVDKKWGKMIVWQKDCLGGKIDNGTNDWIPTKFDGERKNECLG